MTYELRFTLDNEHAVCVFSAENHDAAEQWAADYMAQFYPDEADEHGWSIKTT